MRFKINYSLNWVWAIFLIKLEGNESTAEIARLLHTTADSVLDFSNSAESPQYNVGDGIQKLAKALTKNTVFTELYLGGNHLGSKDAQYLAGMLRSNTMLTVLDFTVDTKICTDIPYGNQIGDAGIKAISEALKTNTSLTTLNVSNNAIGDEGAKALAGMLGSNTSLIKLKCVNEEISSIGISALLDALEENTTLRELEISASKQVSEGYIAGELMEREKKLKNQPAFLLLKKQFRKQIEQLQDYKFRKEAVSYSPIEEQQKYILPFSTWDHEVTLAPSPSVANPSYYSSNAQTSPTYPDPYAGAVVIPNYSNNTQVNSIYQSPFAVQSPSPVMAFSLPTQLQRVSPYIIPSIELDFTQSVELGCGTYAKVYRAMWRGIPVAVKEFKLSDNDNEELESFQREVNIMAKLRFDYIVQFYGFCNEPGKRFIIMQYVVNGSLKKLLHSKQPLHWSLRQQIALDISKGLAFLHSLNFVHQDLKSGNVLLDASYRAIITDFGLSRVLNKSQSIYTNNTKGVLGTLPWMAPELYKPKAKSTKESDVYSYGIVLWEISCRINPYQDVSNPDLLRSWIINDNYRERDEIPVDTPSIIKNLIEICWQSEVRNRPMAREIVETLEREVLFPNNNNNQPSSGGYISNQDSDPPRSDRFFKQ